jgi:hypothetical protein
VRLRRIDISKSVRPQHLTKQGTMLYSDVETQEVHLCPLRTAILPPLAPQIRQAWPFLQVSWREPCMSRVLRYSCNDPCSKHVEQGCETMEEKAINVLLSQHGWSPARTNRICVTSFEYFPYQTPVKILGNHNRKEFAVQRGETALPRNAPQGLTFCV